MPKGLPWGTSKTEFEIDRCVIAVCGSHAAIDGTFVGSKKRNMNPKLKQFCVDSLLLPMVGIGVCLILWFFLSYLTINPKTKMAGLPDPMQTWEQSRQYFIDPFTTHEDDGYRGIGLEAYDSLKLVGLGYAVSLAFAVPVGFVLGSSKVFTRMFDPIFQILRPVSPLAWFPLAGVLVLPLKQQLAGNGIKIEALDWQCVFTIAICSIWPTILNTAVGVRAIPPDYMNVARVLRLNAWKRFTRIQLPATLPYMFTGFRLSLGIAWLVIVAAEMLAGKPGIGNFLWNSYNGNNYGAMISAIIVIGLVGFVLDRLMTVVEKNVPFLLSVPARVSRMITTRRQAQPGVVAKTGSEVKHVPA
jgi:nitrate/nitrite transport system permease protein